MSGQLKSNPPPGKEHPPHGHPENTGKATAQAVDKPSTASHPHPWAADPTLSQGDNAGASGQHLNTGNDATKLANLKTQLIGAIRKFPDWPSPGILFEDIMPIFADPALHSRLIEALELQIKANFGAEGNPDVVVGLEARGFLFGPSLALRLGAGFVPLRKKGKLPGPVDEAGFKKEYGEDFFQIQKGMIKPGQRVLVVDDIIATGMLFVRKELRRGGSASAVDSEVEARTRGKIMLIYVLFTRWICGSRWTACQRRRRDGSGISVLDGVDVFEGQRSSGRACLYIAQRTRRRGGEVSVSRIYHIPQKSA